MLPPLEVLLHTNIWAAIQAIPGGVWRKDAISKLAQACPNLKRIEQTRDFLGSTLRYIELRHDGKSVTYVDRRCSIT